MKKHLLLLLLAVSAYGMDNITLVCMVGNRTVSFPTGQISTTTVQQSFPRCTTTVYLAGTLTLATIYDNNSGHSLVNPFTADSQGFIRFYAANGRYDVQIQGGTYPNSLTSPYVYKDIVFFDFVATNQHLILATPLSSVPGVIGVYDSGGVNYAGFTAPTTLASNKVWTLPSVDAVGCLVSNGSFILSFAACGASSPGGANTNVQYNDSSSFGGDSNFTWVKGTKNLTINGLTSTALYTASNVANTSGGYIDLPPVTYPGSGCLDKFGNPVNIPVPVNGGSFGSHDLIIWNSLSPLAGVSPPGCATQIPTNLDYGVNTNAYFFAQGGFATDQPSYASFQSFTGGLIGGSVIAGGFYPPGTVTFCCGTLSAYTYLGGHMIMGHSNGPPAAGTIATTNNPLTQFEGLEQGMFYWDDALGRAQVYDGVNWVPLGSAGGGFWSLTGSLLYPNNTSYKVLVGNTVDDGTGFALQVTGRINTSIGISSPSVSGNAINFPNGGIVVNLLSVLGGVTTSLLPTTTNTLQLGNGSFYWAGIYGSNGFYSALYPLGGTGTGNLGSSIDRWSNMYSLAADVAGTVTISPGTTPGIVINKSGAPGGDTFGLFVGGSGSPAINITNTGDYYTQGTSVYGFTTSAWSSNDLSLSGNGNIITAAGFVSTTAATNASVGSMRMIASNYFAIGSEKSGTGTVYPIAFFTGANRAETLLANGRALFNLTSEDGSGGQVQIGGKLSTLGCDGCGTLTGQSANLGTAGSGTRVVGTAYHNTKNDALIAAVSMTNGSGSVQLAICYSDNNPSPSQPVAVTQLASGTASSLTFPVLAGNFYVCQGSPLTAPYWTEWTPSR